jgi:phage-related protein
MWRGSSKVDFMTFPEAVRQDMGFGLFLAQMGERPGRSAKTLRGFGGGSVVELRESRGGAAYRSVYTVAFPEAVYVLHAFQKKSKRGISTPKSEIDLVKRRLKALIEERARRP